MSSDSPERTADSDAAPAEFDLRPHVRVLRERWLLILVSTVLVGGAVTLWTLRQPKIYRANATIEHDPNPPRPLGSAVEDVADPMGNYWSTREYFETQNLILASRGMAERVAERLGLHESPDFFGVPEAGFEPRSLEVAARRVQANLEVAPVSKTRLVEISYEDQNPERARMVVNALAEEYIEKQLEDRMGSTVQALDWLGERLDSLRQELGEAELALHEFKREHNVLSVSLEDQQNLLAAELRAFHAALTEARQKRIAAAAHARRLAALSDDDLLKASAQLDGDTGQSLHEMRTQLQASLAERERLAEQLGPAHPRMRALVREIETHREGMRREIEGLVDGANADLAEVREIEAGFREALESGQEQGLELNLREIEYTRLQREQQNKAKLYEVVLERTTETNLTRMLRTSHIRVVDSALTPRSPVKPNVAVNVGAGLFMGLVFGVLIAGLLQLLNRRLRTVEAVEGLGLSVLGILPVIHKDDHLGKVSRRQRAREDAAPSPDRDLIVHHRPTSAVAECARTIRTNLTFMSATDPITSFVVTSGNPREGKTTVACSLAISLAQSGKRVLLVDTDMRRPRLHRTFNLATQRGISSVLVGECGLEDAVQSTMVEGLDVIPCGPVPPNPSELLLSRGFGSFLRDAEHRYDQVIFDSPPIGAVTDAAVLAPQVTGAVVVVKADSTTRDALRSTIRHLKDVGARMLGGVFNDVNAENMSGTYYYGYGHGYYYSEEPDEPGSLDAAE